MEDENQHWEEQGNAAEVAERCSGKQGRQYYYLAVSSVVDSYCNVNRNKRNILRGLSVRDSSTFTSNQSRKAQARVSDPSLDLAMLYLLNFLWRCQPITPRICVETSTGACNLKNILMG
jgi:hypothetical protein